MAYETSTFSSAGDLLNKLRTFLLANGFTVHTTSGDALASPAKLYFTKGIMNVALSHTTETRTPSSPYSAFTEALLVGNVLSDTPIVGNLYDAQYTGANAFKQGIDNTSTATIKASRIEMRNLVNGSSYFFFYSSNTLIIVVHAGNGNYFTCVFSEYVKLTHNNGDTYLGGVIGWGARPSYWYRNGCLDGVSPTGIFKYVDTNDKVAHIYANNSNIQTNHVTAYTIGNESTFPTLHPIYDSFNTSGTSDTDNLDQSNGFNASSFWNSPRGFSGDNPLGGIDIGIWKSTTLSMMLGYIPTIYTVKMTDSSGLTAESEVTIGADTYKIFPILRRYMPLTAGGTSGTLNTLYNNAGGSDGRSGSSSGLQGIAIKKVV